jgi:hypothetical protein
MENPVFSSVANNVYKKLGLPQGSSKRSSFDCSLRFTRKPFISLVPSRIKLILPSKVQDPIEIVHQFHRKRMTMPAMAEQFKNMDIFEMIPRPVGKTEQINEKTSKSASFSIKRSDSSFKIPKISYNSSKTSKIRSFSTKSSSLHQIKFKLS